MSEKYTFRDFMVYFLSGLYILLTLLYEFDISLLKYFKIEKEDITQNPSLTIFLLVPGLYLLGQVVHGIDLLIFKIGRHIEGYALKNNYWLIDKLNCFFNGNRIAGIIAKNRNPRNEKFWKLATKYNSPKSEYWLVINDLLKGLYIISMFWLFYNLLTCNFGISLIFLFLTFIFWYRGRHTATNYVSSVSYLASENSNSK